MLAIRHSPKRSVECRRSHVNSPYPTGVAGVLDLGFVGLVLPVPEGSLPYLPTGHCHSTDHPPSTQNPSQVFLFSALGRLLGPSWGDLGRSWADLGRSWADLRRSWTDLGRSWTDLKRSWLDLERFWTDFW